MAKIRIVGDSSGYVELAAPNAAGNNTLELPSNATKLVGADTNNNVNLSGIITATTFSGRVSTTGISTFSSGINVGTGASISSPETNVLALGTNNSERVRIDSSGRLGIGTNDPTNTLHVVNSSYPTLSADAGSNKELRLQFHTGDNTANVTSIGAFPLVFQTNSIERLRIDSSGRVTMPYQPAFMVRGDESTTKAANSKFSFTSSTTGSTKVCFDRLGNWSDANDRFTAPVTGVYNFSFGIYRQSATTQYSSIAPRVNGSELSNGDTFIIFQSRTPADDTMHVGSFLLNLTAGDYVELFMRGGASTITIYAGHTFFGGYLVG